MRRRALMAASKPISSDNPWGDLPPESTEFGFPLYLNLTEYNADMDEWWRNDDDMNSALYQWCNDNLVEDFSEGYVPLSDDTKIYINGGLVDEIIMDMGTYFLYGASLPFAEVAFDGHTLYGIGAEFPIQTTLQFPLYIYFDYCENIGIMKYCQVNGDFSELRRYLTECAITYGEENGDWYQLTGESISKIGEIYIEDEPLLSVDYSDSFGDMYFYTETYSGQILSGNINADAT